MKIAVVIAGNIPSIMAHSINTVKHAGAFFKMGYSTMVYSVQRYPDWKFLKSLQGGLNGFYGVSPDLRFVFSRDSVRFYFQKFKMDFVYKSIDRLSFRWLSRLFDPEKRIAERMKDSSVDLVYARAYRIIPYLLAYGVPVIAEVHATQLSKELQRIVDLSSDKNFLGISTISPKNKDLFIQWGIPEDKIFVYEDSVDLKQVDDVTASRTELRDELGWPQKKTLVTYCGSLWKGKGINALIQLATAMTDNDRLHFMVIGGPEEIKNEYERECLGQGLNNISFAGFVPNAQVAKYLKASDILILLYSLQEEKRVMDIQATSPIKFFEYMSSNVPIVATRIQRLEEIANDDNVFFVDADDIPGTKEAIETILKNPQLAMQKAQRSYALAQKYSYEKRCERMLAFFDKNG